MTEIKEIPTEKLEIDPYNVRDEPEVKKGIIDNIRSQDVIEPLIVRPLDEDKYGIVVGSRRYLASVRAGEERIPCKVLSLDDNEARLKSLSENIFREDLDHIERENAVYEEWESGKESGKYSTQKELGKELGKSQIWVSENIKAASKRREENIPKEATTRDIDSVSGLEKEEREKILERKVRGEVAASDLRDIRSTMQEASEEAKKEILKIKGKITPEKAKNVVKESEEEPEEKESSEETEEEETEEKEVEKEEEEEYGKLSVTLPESISSKVVQFSHDIGKEPETAINELVKEGLKVKGYE